MLHRLIQISRVIGAAALFLVMCLVFVSVSLRYLFGIIVPDAFDFSRMLLGILIFWGIALAVAQGTMIRVDFLYQYLGRNGRRILAIVASVVTFCVIALVAWRVGFGVVDTFRSGITTQDLRIPIWSFYVIATTAFVVAVAICAMQIRHNFLKQDDDFNPEQSNRGITDER